MSCVTSKLLCLIAHALVIGFLVVVINSAGFRVCRAYMKRDVESEVNGY